MMADRFIVARRSGTGVKRCPAPKDARVLLDLLNEISDLRVKMRPEEAEARGFLDDKYRVTRKWLKSVRGFDETERAAVLVGRAQDLFNDNKLGEARIRLRDAEVSVKRLLKSCYGKVIDPNLGSSDA